MGLAATGYYIGLYWNARRETAGNCAHRAKKFLEALGVLHPKFATWFEIEDDWSRQADSPVALMRMFTGIMARRPPSNETTEDKAGFSLSLATGRENFAIVHITCGSFSKWTGNCVVVRLPSDLAVQQQFLTLDVLREIIAAGVTCWEPEFGVVVSNELDDAVHPEDYHVRVGWLTYLANTYADVTSLREIAIVEPVANFGNLIIASPEPISIDDTKSVDRVREILRRLKESLL